MLLLSVISVVKDDFKGLVQTRDSVMRVKGVDIEWIVVDGTPFREAVDQIASLCTFPVKIISEKDLGPYDAMNKGVFLATGDWILFMNAGDEIIWHEAIPAMLEENADVSILYGSTVYKYQDHTKRKDPRKKLNFNYGMAFCHQAAWYSGSLTKQLHYNMHYRYAADYEMLLRIVEKGATLHPMELEVCLVDPNGISNMNQFAVTRESFQIAGAYGRVGFKESFGFLWRFAITLIADIF